MRDQRAPTASVTIGLRRGHTFTYDQAVTIAAITAASVDGLTTDNVTVTDREGRTMHPSADRHDAGWARQYRHRKQLEADLEAKARLMLAPVLGHGKAVIAVTADVDFTERESTSTTFDKDSSAKTKEDITSIESSPSAPLPVGAAGTANNLTATGGGSTGSSSSSSEEKISTVWEPGSTVETIRQFGGKISRLTISAAVDLPEADPANPNATELTVTQVEKMIQQAVGFDAQRGDQIVVTGSSIVDDTQAVDTVVDTLNRWDFYNNLVRNASLGLAAVVALVLGILLIRKLNPLGALQSSEENSAGARESIVDELSKHAAEDPELVARIISSWLTASPPTLSIAEGTQRVDVQIGDEEPAVTQKAA